MVIVSANSVKVSWDRIIIPEITGYTVYYSQTGNRQSEEVSVTVPSSADSALIEGLVVNVEYQFQVVAVAELEGGGVVMGQRSMVTRIVLHTRASSASYITISM